MFSKTFGDVLPFTAAGPGRHVKTDLSRPDKVPKVAVNPDTCAWLLRMHALHLHFGFNANPKYP